MRILVIRRDNIGDLVCTTPIFTILRKHYPEARIDALVNSYNAPILNGNSALNHVYVYQKAKHRSPGESKLKIWMQTFLLILGLRRVRYDFIILANPVYQASAVKFASLIGARKIVAASRDLPTDENVLHETQYVTNLLRVLNIDEPPGPLMVTPDPAQVAKISLPASAHPASMLVGLHISARQVKRRWSAENFIALAHVLHAKHHACFLLFWSPGKEDNPQHPGDDEMAKRILKACGDLPLLACPTAHLEELVAGLSRCDQLVCSDGGALHIAAALGKPMVCMFADPYMAKRWYPWQVRYELLLAPNQRVSELSVDEVLAAFERLNGNLG